MPEVFEQARLAIDADAAWQRIGDFRAVGEWHPMLDRVGGGGNAPGARRVAHAMDGGMQIERLNSYDADGRVYCYVIERSSLPVRDCTAEFRVDDEGASGSIVTWRARFEVTGDDARGGVASVRRFLRAGADALERRYG